LWGIRGKPKDIIFKINLRAKCVVAHNGVLMEKKFLSKGDGSKVQLEETQETPEKCFSTH
jgi:hypothetical protein